jgi:hypothetical protein
MEVTGDKRSAQTCLDTSPVFFHIVPKLVHALVTYDEIFQAVVVEGGILLPKIFLDIGFNGIIRWKLPASEMFGKLMKHYQDWQFPHPSDDAVKAEVQMWFWEQDISFYCQGLENLVRYDKCLNKFWGLWEYRRLTAKHIHMLVFLHLPAFI